MATHFEDYNVITLKNEIIDYIKWSNNIGLNNNISENPYPVMYIDETPIYEGDNVIFKTNDGNLLIRTIYWQNRFQARHEKWRNQCFLNIKNI